MPRREVPRREVPRREVPGREVPIILNIYNNLILLNMENSDLEASTLKLLPSCKSLV